MVCLSSCQNNGMILTPQITNSSRGFQIEWGILNIFTKENQMLNSFPHKSENTRMHSSRMRTACSLTVSHHILCMPPHNHTCPPPTMHAPQQPHTPPCNHTHCPTTTHAPQQAHMLPAATHAPQQPHTPPQPCTPLQQPCMPLHNHAHPPTPTHTPSNHTCPLPTMYAPWQPHTPPSNHAHPATTHAASPLWTDRHL